MVALTAEEILAFYPNVTGWLPGFTLARLQLHTTYFHHALPRRSMVPGNLGALFFGCCVSAGAIEAMAVVLEAVSRCAYGKEYCQQCGGSFIGDRQ